MCHHRTIWLLALALLAGPGFAQERLTIDQAISMAVQRNRDLIRSDLSVRQSELGVQSAKSVFRPTVKPEGSVGTTGDGTEWSYGLAAEKLTTWGTGIRLSGGVRDLGDAAGESNRYASVQVEASQPLFRNFGPLVNAEALTQAGEQVKRARRQWEQQKADLILQVVRTFEQIIRLREQIRADEAYFDRMDKLYALTKARESQGRTTRVDSLRVELQRGEAQSRLENSRESLTSLSRDLADLLGLPLETSFDLVVPPLLEISLLPAEDAVDLAFRNRLDYAQAMQDLGTSLRQVRIAKRGYLPNVSLSTRYRQFGQGADTSEAMDLDEDEWFVGLSGDVDFNPSQTRIAVRQALVDAESTREAIEIQRYSIAREVLKGMSDYRRTHSELEIAARNSKLAQSRAELARNLFQMGRGDNFTVTDAEQSAIEAQIRLLAARAEASISGYEFMRSVGTLVETPDELKPPPEEAK